MIRSMFILLSFVALFYACADKTKPIIDDSAAARIDSTLQYFIDSGTFAGASALIYEKDREVYYNAFGMADREAGKPMERNTIVQIFSMTKPITGVAFMLLYEEGAFQLDDPLSMYAPEFADMKVYAGQDPSGEPILEDPRREMTIRDLTRHTSGFATGPDNPGVGPLFAGAMSMEAIASLSEFAHRLGSVPLWFHPGDRWSYGLSVDVQAFLVERISGQPFYQFVRERILDPLGMTQTRYYVPENDRDRFAALYTRNEDGTLTRVPDEQAHAFNTRRDDTHAGRLSD
jgi:CubicO group peptidase (beta-lactamase class C family)